MSLSHQLAREASGSPSGMREGHRPLRDARRCAYGRALRLLGDEHPGATATTTFAEFRQRGPPSRLPGTGGSAHGPHFGGGTRMPLLAAERPERGTPGPQGGPSKGRPQVVRSVDRRESSRKRFRKRTIPVRVPHASLHSTVPSCKVRTVVLRDDAPLPRSFQTSRRPPDGRASRPTDER
jgi:hypothetical protein